VLRTRSIPVSADGDPAVAAATVHVGASGLTGLAAGALLASAVLFGSANTVGSAALPIWTAGLVPDEPAAAFTTALFVGSVGATVTPR
jgi:hypothetical protein